MATYQERIIQAGKERRAEVIRLRREGLSFNQIARVLECSPQNVQKLYAKARLKGEVPAETPAP